MFIGEMLSWLVIGIYSIVKHIRARRPAPLLEADENDALLGDADTLGDDDPLASSLILPNDGREHLGGWRVTLLALPAVCDIAGTTLMNVGLLFVAASIYQMTRGALVLFVGLFSVLFLKRYLKLYKWFALIVVVSGVAVVGLAGAIEKDHKAVPSSILGIFSKGKTPEEENVAVRTLIGVLLIAAAQIFTATQFVLEESIMERYSLEPLKAVGWEGLWGFIVTVIGMAILHFAWGQTDGGRYGYFDAREGLYEMFHHRAIAVSSVLIMISIGYVVSEHQLFTYTNHASVVSISSDSPSLAQSQQLPAQQSIPAVPCSSGSSP
jgi:drug/metabolite transporter (DMT)-like permease